MTPDRNLIYTHMKRRVLEKPRFQKERGPLSCTAVSLETMDPSTGWGKSSSKWGNGKFQSTKG